MRVAAPVPRAVRTAHVPIYRDFAELANKSLLTLAPLVARRALAVSRTKVEAVCRDFAEGEDEKQHRRSSRFLLHRAEL